MFGRKAPKIPPGHCGGCYGNPCRCDRIWGAVRDLLGPEIIGTVSGGLDHEADKGGIRALDLSPGELRRISRKIRGGER